MLRRDYKPSDVVDIVTRLRAVSLAVELLTLGGIIYLSVQHGAIYAVSYVALVLAIPLDVYDLACFSPWGRRLSTIPICVLMVADTTLFVAVTSAVIELVAAYTCDPCTTLPPPSLVFYGCMVSTIALMILRPMCVMGLFLHLYIMNIVAAAQAIKAYRAQQAHQQPREDEPLLDREIYPGGKGEEEVYRCLQARPPRVAVKSIDVVVFMNWFPFLGYLVDWEIEDGQDKMETEG